MSTNFDIGAARSLMNDVFAPWIRALDLEVVAVSKEMARLRMPFSDSLCREGGVICGQALMAAADTAMVFAISAAGGRYRPMTTVDQTTHFLRPACNEAVLIEASVQRMGKSMAFGRANLTSERDGKAIASAQTVYALLSE